MRSLSQAHSKVGVGEGHQESAQYVHAVDADLGAFLKVIEWLTFKSFTPGSEIWCGSLPIIA